EILLASHDLELGAMRIVGERLDDVGAGVHEVAVEALDEVGMLEDDLRDEGAGLQISAALELEQVALGADDGPGGEPFEQSGGGSRLLRRRRLGRHDGTIYHKRRSGCAASQPSAACVVRAPRQRDTASRGPAMTA